MIGVRKAITFEENGGWGRVKRLLSVSGHAVCLSDVHTDVHTSGNSLLCVLMIYALFCILQFNKNIGDKREIQDQDRFLFWWMLLCLFKMLDLQQPFCDHEAIRWAKSKTSRTEKRKDPGFIVPTVRRCRGGSLSLNLCDGSEWWFHRKVKWSPPGSLLGHAWDI